MSAVTNPPAIKGSPNGEKSPSAPSPRTALVHYWLVRMRGGENVLAKLMNINPDADVFTNVYDPAGVKSMFSDRKEPICTWVNRLPLAKKIYPIYMPLMPSALEMLDMSAYDLIISSESGPAKWVIPAPNAAHICYVHTPMRYLWDQRHLYRNRVPLLGKPIFDKVTRSLRREDLISASRVDQFVANSSFVAQRINRYYRREAIVIPPPVELSDLRPSDDVDDYYLFVGQLISYKLVRHAIDACLQLGRRLVVVGDGPDARYVRSIESKYIEWIPRLTRDELVAKMAKCRALLFPGVEDFGIVPVEVLGSGRPVIAYRKGGALDTVVHGATGMFYDDPSAGGLSRAILDFEAWLPEFSPHAAVQSAERFSGAVFERRWKSLVADTL